MVKAHLGHVHGQELFGRGDDVLGGGSDDHLGVDRFEEDVEVRRELRMKVLQHQVSGDGAKVAHAGVGNLSKVTMGTTVIFMLERLHEVK